MPSGPGTYALLIELDSLTVVQVGRLGPIEFREGWYTYVGSALSGVAARVGRHLRQRKKLHWHVDYLLEKGRLSDVMWGLSQERLECRIADGLRQQGLHSLRGFGTSDCRCASHLFFSASRKTLRDEIAHVFSLVGLTPNQYERCTSSLQK